MKTAAEIVEALARGGRTEQIVRNVCPQLQPAAVDDLVSIVHLHLLEMDPLRLADLDESGALPFYIARMAKNSTTWENGTFRQLYTDYEARAVTINPNRNRNEERPDD